jgi:gamma-glutamyltranspeptidase
LGETLAVIAETGPSAFYQGELSAGICEEIQANGGIITVHDLMTYQARVKPALQIKLENNYTAYGVPPPASSAITLLILKVMDGEYKRQRIYLKILSENLGYGLTPQSLDSDEKQVRFYHILNEVFKFAYGKRSALGDEYDSQTDKNQEIEKVRNLFDCINSQKLNLVTKSDSLS